MSAMRETRATGLLVQNLMMRNLSTTPARALRLAAIGLGIGLVMTVSAARAGDDEEDTRTFSQKFVDGVKAGFTITNMDSKGIDYRERSPLVVPPQLDLPPPAAAAREVNAPNWPKDPDEKRRKAALAARKKTLTNSTHELTPAEAEAARASLAASGQPQPQQSLTEKMNNYLGGTKPEVGQFKGEPERETLTQPPPGYQIPSPNYAYGVGLKGPHKDADNKDSTNKDSKESSSKP
jgi:type IV secretory pathway VirB10-like protein